MAFADSFFNAINNANPLNQGASIVKYLIIAVVVIIIFFFLWITVMTKDNYTPARLDPSTRMYGIIPKIKLT
jgi:phosphotransferase system  glucose/maltose/N-acetylglucosamine-specific IIC component